MFNVKNLFLAIVVSITSLSTSASVQVIHDITFPESTNASDQVSQNCDNNKCENQVAKTISK